MTTVQVYTAQKVKQIEDALVTNAEVVDGNLILTKKNGETINVTDVITQEELDVILQDFEPDGLYIQIEEDPNDPGLYFVLGGLTEDPEAPGVYLIGV